MIITLLYLMATSFKSGKLLVYHVHLHHLYYIVHILDILMILHLLIGQMIVNSFLQGQKMLQLVSIPHILSQTLYLSHYLAIKKVS